MLVKNIIVKNPKNVLVQIPGFLSENWSLKENSILEMHAEDDYIKIVPKGRRTDESSERLAKQSAGH